MLPNDLFADSAQTFGVHTEERCDILHGYIVQQLRLLGHEFEITFFSRKRG